MSKSSIIIQEEYWKDGKLHCRGRRIEYYGDYYIGEWKEGWKNGEGTYYYNNGDRYEGGWKDCKKYGQGTIYINGDKYIAQWDWNKYKEKLTTRTELNISPPVQLDPDSTVQVELQPSP